MEQFKVGTQTVPSHYLPNVTLDSNGPPLGPNAVKRGLRR